ncbi:MAG: thymidine kinase [Bacillota bacterium]|nr:thymidine kinase [Bacillota bacterium]
MAGYLEVICGGMYSGKSSELIRRITRAKYARKQVQLFKPALDRRYHTTKIVAHDSRNHEAHVVTRVDEILNAVLPDTDIVAIDEIQFFPPDATIAVVNELLAQGKKVIVAGLDIDFAGRPFGAVPYLLAIADEIDKIKAICIKCGKKAYVSQRLVDGQPASIDDPQIKVGGVEAYEARCRECWELKK